MSRWLVALAVAGFVALSAGRADAQVFKPRNGAPAKGSPSKTAAADKPDKPAAKPAADKKTVAAADKPDKPERPAVRKRPAAAKRPAKKHKKADDDDDTVTVEDDDVKISDD